MKKSVVVIGIFFLVSLYLYSFYRSMYQINPGICDGCGECTLVCPENAIIYDEILGTLQIEQSLCSECGDCVLSCPRSAIFEIDGSSILYGTVTDLISSFPIHNAEIYSDTVTTFSGMWGKYWINLQPGIYDIHCIAENYEVSSINDMELDENEIIKINFSLFPLSNSVQDGFPVTEICITNYPNPFNPTTEIRFQVSDFREKSNLQIVIYNLKGQKVKTILINSSSDLPINSITWNGTNHNNQSVSSGIYYCVLKENDLAVAHRKMVLMK